MPLDLETELESAIEALTRANVPYALCGGLALAIHGHPRATRDIDLLVPPTAISAALDSLASSGYPLRAGPMPLGVGTPHPLRLFRATRVMENRHLTVDLLEVSAPYEGIWESRVALEWRGRPLTVVSRQGLIEMKRLSARLKDRSDVELLEGTGDEG